MVASRDPVAFCSPTFFVGNKSGKYKKPSGVTKIKNASTEKKGTRKLHWHQAIPVGSPWGKLKSTHGNLIKICNKMYPKIVINNSPRIICQLREFEMLLCKSFAIRSWKKFPYIVIHLAEMIAGQKFSGTITLPETNIAPENRQGPKRKYILQPSIFRGKPLVSGSVLTTMILQKKRYKKGCTIIYPPTNSPQRLLPAGWVGLCGDLSFLVASPFHQPYLVAHGKLGVITITNPCKLVEKSPK